MLQQQLKGDVVVFVSHPLYSARHGACFCSRGKSPREPACVSVMASRKTGLHWLPQAVCVGRLFRQADRRAAREPKARGRSGGRSAAERSAVAQRGKASSRSPTRRTQPTGSARRRGSRLGNRRQGAARRRRGSRAPVRRFRGGGVARAPSAAGAGKRLKSGEALTAAQPRPAGRVETLARAWSAPLEVGRGRGGGAGIRAHDRASSPGKPPPGVQPGTRGR